MPIRNLLRSLGRKGTTDFDADELRDAQKAEERARRISESEAKPKSRLAPVGGGGLGLAAVAGILVILVLYILIAMGFRIQ